MTVYFLMYAALFGMTWYAEKKNLPQKRSVHLVSILFGVLLTLIVGLRHPSMGSDLEYGEYYGYLFEFGNLQQFSLVEMVFMEPYLNYEKGFVILNKLIGAFWNNQQFYIFCCAVLSIAPIAYTLYKESDDPLFAAVIYFGLPCFLITYSALRQAIAVALCFASLIYLRRKDLVRFAALVILASTMHSSALVFLVAYPLYHIRLSQKLRLASIIALPVVFVLRTPIFMLFAGLFREGAQPDNNGAYQLFLVFVLIYIFCIVFAQRDARVEGYLNIFYFACVIQAMGGIYSIVVRLGYYFMIALPLLLPRVVKTMRIPKAFYTWNLPWTWLKTPEAEVWICKAAKTAIYVCFVAFGLYSIWVSGTDWAMAYPYRFFWQQ